jgi:hypothetical protein
MYVRIGSQIMKRKLKQWWSTNRPISSKRSTVSHLKLVNTKRNMTCGIGNPGPGLGLLQKLGRVKSVNGILR